MEHKTRFDDAVSPVVGVILMVAVTVILSAVIGTFVLDLGNNVQANPQAGVSISQSDSTVTVQAVSIENADGLYVKNESGYYNTTSGAFDLATQPSSYTLNSAGDSITAAHGGDTITVIGELDGKQAVLQTYDPSA